MKEWFNKCHFGDCIETMRRMPDGIVQTCVTSPPYFGLRDYGHAGAPSGGVVLDPFFGSGTTGEVSQNLGRAFIGCELNPSYEPLQRERLRQPSFILEHA